MPDEQKIDEQIQTAYGPHARPTDAMRTRALKSALLHVVPQADFPAAALGLMAVLLAGLALWLITGQNVRPDPTAAALMVGVLGVNAVCVPLSAFLVIQRRRNAKKP